ncbi:WD-40 repeat-containing protein [Calothrix sp. NIES-4071]|nr:WD-40 repeat-containing protein [Calothrix sp. NIES-4071]BAZ60412.1 WD-40 repeat-containing protein [Calothrix sp. NIES-4105]
MVGRPSYSENVIAANERAVNSLLRAITFSQGQFSLCLVGCNYNVLRQQMLRCLEEKIGSGYRIQKVTLKSNAISLYSTIHAELGSSQPSALMILGLESVEELDDLLRTINHIRDEFRKRHPFPMVFWVNDELLRKLRRFAPDFTSWAATPIRFEMTTEELRNFLLSKTNSLFAKILDINGVPEGEHPHTTLGQVWDYSSYEFRCSIKELQHRGIELEPELDASVQFIAGLDYYASNRIDLAIEYFQDSLKFWLSSPTQTARIAFPTFPPIPPSPFLLRQGVLLFYLGLSYYRLAERVHVEHQERWQEAKSYLQQCLNVFEIAGRPDLMAQIIGLLGDVLQHLKLWDELQQLALKSQNLHHDYGTHFQLACDSGFLAQVGVAKENWDVASKQARVALLRLDEAKKNNYSHPNSFPLLKEQIYRLTLAKALLHLGEQKTAREQIELASKDLESALENSDFRYEVYKYIRSLRWLRTLYFELGRYLEAFTIRQKRRSVEQQYGLRAFIGAGRLKPQRHATTPIANSPAPSGSVALEIIASGRQRDVLSLIARISRPDQKLTVIHGPSGVGKSSTVTAGLVPALQQRAIGDQIAIPVVLQVYTDWVQELGEALRNAIASTKPVTIRKAALEEDILPPATPITIDGVLELLQQNAQNHIITVLIFDQVEEFFSGCSNLSQLSVFDKFLCDCMNVAFVKVILSLREDYLHKLLEFKYLEKIAPINENILDKSIRYQLKNFSCADASSVIRDLTQRSQYHLEPELIDALVDDLSAELGEVRPIELQVVGAQLQDERIITLAKYQQFRPNKLIERYLGELIRDCGKENERAALLVLYLLTDENKKRPFKTRAELAIELEELEDVKKLELILEILVRSGLVILYPDVPERYQLIHDYLVDLIRTLQQAELSLQEQVRQLRAQVVSNELEISRLNSALRHDKQGKIQAEHQVAGSDLLSELKELRKRDESGRVERERLLSEIEQQKLQAELIETEKLRTSQAKTNRLLKNALFASVFGILLLMGSIWTAFSQANKAFVSASVAASASSEALFSLGKDIDALREGLRAGRKIESALFLPDTQTQQLVRTALNQATYGMRVREVNRLEGHLADVNSVVFSPNGSLIASASRDGMVRLWQANGKKIRVLKGHSKRVNSVAFSPSGTMLVSGSSDKTVKLWTIDGKLLRTLTHDAVVNSVAFSPDGKTIASGGADDIVKLWNKEGKALASLRGHTLPITSLAIAPDGSIIASASSDKTIKLWSRDGKLLQTLVGHDDTVLAVAWAPNSNMLASTGWDKTVKLWSRDGKLLNSIPAHKQVIMSVAFSPDGKTLASASWDKTVKLWNLNAKSQKLIEQPIEILKGHNGWVTSVNFSSDGQTLASASSDTNIKLWRWKYLPLKSIQAHSKDVTMLSYSHQGDIFASSSKDGTVKIWSLDGKLQHTLPGHKDAWDISFSQNGQTIASASSDNTVKLWSRNGKLLKTLEGHLDSVLSVDWAPDGEILASASKDNTVRLWSKQGKLLTKLIRHNDAVNWVSFSPNGKYIASASDDNTVKISDTDGKLIKTITAHNRPVYAVVWSKDNTLATASLDSTVKLWDKNWNLIGTLNGEGEGFTSVSFSPDGQTIATMSEDKIKLWNRKSELELVINAEDYIFTTVSFTPDSKTLITGNSKGKVVFRNLADTHTDKLMEKGCLLLRDYLQNNTKVSKNDRNLCP